MIHAKTKASIQLVLVMLVVALVTVLAKQTLENVDTFTFVWLQMLFGAGAIVFYTFIIKKERLPSRLPVKAWMIMCLIGFFNFTIVKTLFIISLEKLPVTTHAYLVNFVGIVTMIFSALWLKEPPKKTQVFGVLIALVGIHIYFDIVPQGDEFVGVLLVVCLVVFLALTNILIRLLHLKFPNRLSPNLVSSVAVVCGALPLVTYGLFQIELTRSISPLDWLIIVSNGIFAIALTMNIFNIVMRHLKAYEASVLASTGLIFTAIYSVLILNDNIVTHQIVGIALLLVGIICVQYFSKKQTGKL